MSSEAELEMAQSELRKLSTCDVADALLKVKVPSGGYLAALDLVSPSPALPSSTAFRLCGPAFTVLFHHNITPAPPLPSSSPSAALSSTQSSPKKHHIDAAPAGSIMVIQSPSDAICAVWGGLMSAGAKAKGLKGAVIDGNCRDLVEHREMGFPVFAKGHSILGTSPFLRPVAHQIPLTIPAPYPPTATSATSPSTALCPSVTVHPGDLILADIDGVVCVPLGLVEEVVRLAKKGKAEDENIMWDLREGKGVRETMSKYRG